MLIIKLIYRIAIKIFENIKWNAKTDKIDKYFFNNNCCDKLLISVDFGGGVAAYENCLIKQNDKILILRHLRYSDFFNIINTNNNTNYIINKKNICNLFSCNFKEIIISSFVGYDDISQIMNLIKLYSLNNPNCKIIYLVHNYHCISINHSLFFNGKYIRPKELNRNLKQLYGFCFITIDDWQKLWLGIFDLCSEIRCFSYSSKSILSEAFNYERVVRKMTVVPHDMSYCHNTAIYNIHNMKLCIAFVGACHYLIKGKEVVKKILLKYGNDITINLFGSYYSDFRIHRKKVFYFGQYDRNNLQNLLTNSNTSLVIFPSLAPETFSYVLHELTPMEIPIVCFNVGAQAEYINTYKYGKVVKDIDELFEYIENKNSI